MRLGLDLQGGIHWVVGVQLEAAVARELDFQRSAMLEQLAKDGVTRRSRQRRRWRSLRIQASSAAEDARPELGEGAWPCSRPVSSARRRARVHALRPLAEGSSRSRHGAGPRGAAPPHRGPDPGHSGFGRDAPGRRPHAGADPGRPDRSLARAGDAQGHRLPRVQDRARDGAERGAAAREAPERAAPPTPRSPSSAKRRRSACSRPSWSGTRPISPATISRTRASASTSASARS